MVAREVVAFSGVIQKASGPKTVRIRQKREMGERIGSRGGRVRETWYKTEHLEVKGKGDHRTIWRDQGGEADTVEAVNMRTEEETNEEVEGLAFWGFNILGFH